jgi:hypothetical protein
MKKSLFLIISLLSLKLMAKEGNNHSELDYYKYFTYVAGVESAYDLRAHMDDLVANYVAKKNKLPLSEVEVVAAVDLNSFECIQNVCVVRADMAKETFDKHGDSIYKVYPNSGLLYQITFALDEVSAGEMLPLVQLVSVEE